MPAHNSVFALLTGADLYGKIMKEKILPFVYQTADSKQFNSPTCGLFQHEVCVGFT